MKYVKYFVVVAVLLIAVGILSGCGESEEDVLSEMPEGLYPMCEKGDFQELWGYVDETGEYVIEPQFLYAGYFVNRCDRRVFIDPQFDSARDFVDGYAIVGNLDRKYIPEDSINDYNIKGFIIDSELERCNENINDTLKGWDFDRGPKYQYDKKTKNAGYVDANGKWVIKPNKRYGIGQSVSSYFFNDHMLVFEVDKDFSEDDTITLSGFLNETGQEVIPAQFCQVLLPFNDGVALVASPAKKDGEKATYGYINKKGKYLIEKKYEFESDDF